MEICSGVPYQSGDTRTVAAVGNKGIFELPLADNLVGNLQVKTVLWLQDLNIELAFRVVISHRPRTHDGVLVLHECECVWGGVEGWRRR